MKFSLAVLALTAAAWGASLCSAGAATGGLSGYVRDRQGKPVPLAVVTVTTDRGDVKQLHADPYGFFVDLTMETGSYTLSAADPSSGMHGCANVAVYPDESSRTVVQVVAARATPLDCWSIPTPLVDGNQTADVYTI